MGLTVGDGVALGTLFVSMAVVVVTLGARLIAKRNGHQPLPQCLLSREDVKKDVAASRAEVRGDLRNLFSKVNELEKRFERFDERFERVLELLKKP